MKKNVQILDHVILILGVLFMLVPVWITFASSTHRPEVILADGMQFWFGDYFWETYSAVLTENTGFTESINASLMLSNSMILGLGFAIGKILVSTIAAYAIVYFRFPLGSLVFWIIFSSLLLPLEVRIIPSYEVVADLGLLNTYTGPNPAARRLRHRDLLLPAVLQVGPR